MLKALSKKIILINAAKSIIILETGGCFGGFKFHNSASLCSPRNSATSFESSESKRSVSEKSQNQKFSNRFSEKKFHNENFRSKSSSNIKNKPKTNQYMRIDDLVNNHSRTFRGVDLDLDADCDEGKKSSFKGRSNEFDLTDQDPEEFVKYEEELDAYGQNPDLYHAKIIEGDVKKRRQIKLAIIKKKVNKIEGFRYRNTNLLTWDAKEQIKYLNMTYPGNLNLFRKFFDFIRDNSVL